MGIKVDQDLDSFAVHQWAPRLPRVSATLSSRSTLNLEAVTVNSEHADADDMAASVNDLRNACATLLILTYVSVERSEPASRILLPYPVLQTILPVPAGCGCSICLRCCSQTFGGRWMNDGHICNDGADIWKHRKDVTPLSRWPNRLPT
jgi:hypothetical protein